MGLPINDQQQPRPYLAPFSHSTSVTNKQTDGQMDDSHDNSSTVTKVHSAKRETDIPPGHFPPGRFSLLFCIPGHFPPTSACVAFFPESDVVDGMQLSAARLRYRHGRGRQATDAASDLLQWLTTTTTTTTAPLFRASRCVHCRRCSRGPPGTCMSPR